MIALNCDQYRPEPGSLPRCLMGSFGAMPNATRARAAEEWPEHLLLSPRSPQIERTFTSALRISLALASSSGEPSSESAD